MKRTMTLEIPDETYDAIQARAAARGATPEQIVLEQLTSTLGGQLPGVTDAAVSAQPAQDDPLEALIGTLTGDVTDVADRHDDYIGRALANPGDESQPPAGG